MPPPHCPICLRPFLPETRTCVHCHFDLDRGLDEDTWIGRVRLGTRGLTCTSCGYDLRGLTQLRCPECGQVVAPAQPSGDDAKRVVREAYLTPLLMLLSAGSIVLGVTAWWGGSSVAAEYLLGFAVEMPAGLLVFFACCLVWLGFDAPLHLSALRIAGIFASLDLFLLLGGFLIHWIILWAAGIILLVWLLSELLELDLDDAFPIGFLMFFAKAGAGQLAAYVLL